MESFDHPIALFERGSAVQEEDLTVKGLLQVSLQQVAHLAILGEDQCAMVLGYDLLQHLHESVALAAAMG